ncbi:hypothetical protein MXE38_10100 [Anaerobiospirillum sp. NML120448]|uniref:hypothetical protein n=1 Tax=Anaerobiospirillum sp. NML120448 TaxID=2932816 RepID=UPI001FF1BBA0|nr:hypothetical protein [Anaerobiospirillum sp. NML120448]MCK0515186.1 hypothetical protein [Anaerobiospirillum sp. NML120448]
MKWFQAHLRVMSRLFELGVFDEVNASYRRMCCSDSAEDQAHFLELVLNKEIREHCHHLFYTQPNYKQCDRRSFNVVLQFHYDVVAGLTLFKVVAPFAKSNFVKANVSTTFPVSFYKALFEPSGKIKDDVLMAAFNNKSYVRSPHQFVVEFLVYRRNSYLFDSDCTIKTLKHDIRYDPFLFAENARYSVASYYISEEEKAAKFENAQGYCIEEPTDSQKINYFQIDSRFDYGFGLLKVIDLLGMNLLLVAQRRHYLFKCLRNDDVRSNFKALIKVSCEEIVCLHNNAVSACSAYEKAHQSLLSNQISEHEVNAAVSSYVARTDALYQYLRYFCHALYTLKPFSEGTNNRYSWQVSFYYFNIYTYFADLTESHEYLLKKIVNLLGSKDVVEDFKELLLADQKQLNDMVKTIPHNIYKACAHYAPFNNQEQIHPRVVDFEEVVNSVLSYSHNLNDTTICLPSPIKELSTYALEDSGKVDWPELKDIAMLMPTIKERLGMTNNQLIHLRFAKSVLRTCGPMEFNRKLNVYLDMFSFASLLVEAFNYTYLTAIFNAVARTESEKSQPIIETELEFDLTDSNIKWVECVFPHYQMLLQDEVFREFIETHQDCFKHLTLILDLQGQSNLLYADGYMTSLLHITDTYDEELAQSLSKKRRVNNEAPLNKAEQLLLNKTCINLIQGCHKLCTLGKELLTRKMDLFEGCEGFLGKFIANKAQVFSYILTLCSTPIYAFSNYIIQGLVNVPAELMPNADLAPGDYLVNEANQKFYKDLYETLMVVLANDVNEYARIIVPYAKLTTKEDLAKSLSSITLIEPRLFYQGHYNSVMLAYGRFLDDKYDQAMNQQISKNTFFANSALYLLISKNFECLPSLLIAIKNMLINHVCRIDRVKHVKEFSEYYNVVYNIVHRLNTLSVNNEAKLNMLRSLAYQDNVVLSESFEYKSYLSELTYAFSLLANLCKQYSDKDSDLESVYNNGEIENFLALYTDLLKDSNKVLMQINGKYFNEIFMKENVVCPYFINKKYHIVNDEYIDNYLSKVYRGLFTVQSGLVEYLFGKEVYYHTDLKDFVYSLDAPAMRFTYMGNREQLTKVTCKMADLVKEKLHLMSDSELNKLLNIDSKLISTQIVDSSTSNAATKPQAATVAKSKASTVKAKAKATTTKSKAAKAIATSATEPCADEATNATDATDVKPKKKATRAKKATTADATASVAASIKASPEVVVEAKADGAAKSTTKANAEAKAKANSTTKATATKSRAKKVATATSTEANADAATEATKATGAKPKQKASTARTNSKASSSTRAKKSTDNS